MAQNLFKAMTPEGAALSNLVSSLYSPDAAVKRQERDALVAQRSADAELKRAQIEKYRMEKDAAEAKRKQEATWLSDAVAGFGRLGQQETQDSLAAFNAGGVVQPKSETAEMPGIMGGYQMDPTIQALIGDLQGMEAFSRGLPGKTNALQAQQALGARQSQGWAGDVVGGKMRPQGLAAVMAALKGTLPFKENATGGTLDQYDGAQNQTSPLAVASIGAVDAKAGADRALAGQRGALDAKTRSETLPQQSVPSQVPGAPPIRVLGKDLSREAAKGAAGAPQSGLSDDAVEHAAHRYVVDGTMPPNLGRGAQGEGTKVKILNRAAEIAKASGQDGMASRITQIAGRAGSGALLQLTKQEQMVGAFEKNALRNADVALAESAKVDRTGSPVLNRWLLAGQKEVLGDPDVSRFHAATITFVNEYAKIMSGSMGNTAVSDSLRRETESLLATKDTPEQFAATIDLMKQEMRNRMLGFQEQKAELSRTFGGGNASAAPPPVAPSAAASGPKRFSSEAEAVAAEASGTLKKGERVIIGNTPGTWQ